MYNKTDKVLSAKEFIDIIDGTLKDNPKYDNFYKYEDQGYKSVVIDDVTINEEVRLTESFYTNETIYIKGGTFNEHLYLDKGVFRNPFYIYGGKFNAFVDLGATHNSYVSISGASFTVLRLSGGYYEGWVSISGEFNQLQIGGGAVFNYIFELNNCKADSLIIISGGYFRDKFKINGNISAEKLRIGYPNKGISEALFINELHIKTEKYLDMLVINTPIINCIYFKNVINHKDSKLYFSDIKVNQIIFDNFNNHGYISFKDLTKSDYYDTSIKVSRLKKEYRRKENENWVRPVAILNSKKSISPKLVIDYSNLGKIDFIGCNLSSFDLEFAYSKITEIFLAGTKMPTSITTPKEKENVLYSQQRLGYSQIKKIHENRGDSVEAGNYHAREMDSYFNSLNYFENGWEKFNLLLSKASSYYGQSWKRGLFSLFVVSMILFYCYCHALGYKLALPATDYTLNNFHELESYLLEFMNPLHKADYIPEQLYIFHHNQKPPLEYMIPRQARLIDILSRIIIGFFLYQFIQAFRRYGKKAN